MILKRIVIVITLLIIISIVISSVFLLSFFVPKSNLWAEEAIQIDNLHNLGLFGSEVTIGIIDTGADINHHEFDISSFINWTDVINHKSKYYDDDDQGTHLAGILVSKGSFQGLLSGVNIYGIAPNSKIIIVKSIPQNQYLYGGGNDSTISAGIKFCIDNDVDILLLSIGMSPEDVDFTNNSKTSEKIQEALDMGIFVVTPAGNDRQNDDGDVCFPSNLKDVISVGSISKGNILSSFSSKGHQYPWSENPNKKPELVAPGQDIWSTRSNGAYGKLSGSSQAATYVVGCIALLLDAYPEYKHDGEKNQNITTINLFKEIFAKTAKKIGSLQNNNEEFNHDDYYGYGLIQLYEAYKELAKY